MEYAEACNILIDAFDELEVLAGASDLRRHKEFRLASQYKRQLISMLIHNWGLKPSDSLRELVTAFEKKIQELKN